MHDPHDHEPDSTGFECTRRTVLKTGAALGTAASAAGCNETDDLGDPDATPTEPPPLDPMSNFTDDGLEIVDSALVEDDEVWIDLGGNSTATPSADAAFSQTSLQVRVRNTLDEVANVVTVTAEIFDEDLDFLGTQSAMISSLLSQEVFEGYIPYYYPNAAAYVLRAERSSRPYGQADINRLNLEYHCMGNEQVSGTVRNATGVAVERCRVLVRFYDGDGDVLGTGTDTITGLEGNGTAEYEVDVNAVVERNATSIEDYTVTVGDYAGNTFAVR